MNIKELNYDDRLKLLKEIFDNTNIVITGCYGSTATASSNDICFVLDKPSGVYDKNGGTEHSREDFWKDNKTAPKLIAIHTDICSG